LDTTCYKGLKKITESFLLERLLSGDTGETEGRGVKGWRRTGKIKKHKKFVEFSSFSL
jgi:hypothetical protein